MDANELADCISQMDAFTNYQRGKVLAAAAELRRLKALEKDATRYRWLRDEMTATDFGRITHESGMPLIGSNLDAAVDAAMENK